MKKKINKMMILIATVTILLTMVLITVVYYDLFRRQVLEDLKSYGSLLKSCSSVEEIKENGVPVESDLRLTLIGSDGQVLYDNEADSVAMGNHASRPEIQVMELKKVVATTTLEVKVPSWFMFFAMI